MSVPLDQELIDRWRGEEAPLLPLLHAFHERDGFLSEAAIRAVSAGLKIPLADLYGTVTFYHHLSRVPEGLGRRDRERGPAPPLGRPIDRAKIRRSGRDCRRRRRPESRRAVRLAHRLDSAPRAI